MPYRFSKGDIISGSIVQSRELDNAVGNYADVLNGGMDRDNMPNAGDSEIREHLNYYLFRSNDQVYADIKTLSGGERARLSMATIASRPFKLLILDEPTNNIDMETTDHLVDVLNNYTGSLLVISHDNSFLQKIGADSEYLLD